MPAACAMSPMVARAKPKRRKTRAPASRARCRFDGGFVDSSMAPILTFPREMSSRHGSDEMPKIVKASDTPEKESNHAGRKSVVHHRLIPRPWPGLGRGGAEARRQGGRDGAQPSRAAAAGDLIWSVGAA